MGYLKVKQLCSNISCITFLMFINGLFVIIHHEVYIFRETTQDWALSRSTGSWDLSTTMYPKDSERWRNKKQ